MKTYLLFKGNEIIMVKADSKKEAIGYLRHSRISVNPRDMIEYKKELLSDDLYKEITRRLDYEQDLPINN